MSAMVENGNERTQGWARGNEGKHRRNGNKVIYILSVVSDYVLHTSSPLFPPSLDSVCVLL